MRKSDEDEEMKEAGGGGRMKKRKRRGRAQLSSDQADKMEEAEAGPGTGERSVGVDVLW